MFYSPKCFWFVVGHVKCVLILLQNGAKGTARMSMGWTPAHCASEAGKMAVLKALVTAKVPVNKKDKYGDTPMRTAEIYGHWDIVEFLKT